MARTHPNQSLDTLISLIILGSIWHFVAFPYILALLCPMVSMNAFHSANLFLFSRYHIPTNSIKLHFLLINIHTTHNSSNFSDEGLLHSKCQLFNSIQWPIYFINSVNNTKLPCYALPLMQHHSFFRN